MKTTVAPIGLVTVTPTTSSDGAGFADQRTASEAERLARYRLVIEEGPGSAFVYKTLDRVTGEVVSQFPREEVLKLQADPAYAAGSVITTTA